MPRKTLKERRSQRPTEDSANRIRGIMDSLVGNENPEDLMMQLMSVLSESGRIPEEGKFYTFVYRPKTPNIEYDQFPLVAVADVFQWGFRGINFHWGEYRQYTWQEVVGQLYELDSGELADAIELPFAYFRLNN